MSAKDLVEARAFARRRLAVALVRASAHGELPRSAGRVLAGLVLAVLVVVVQLAAPVVTTLLGR